MINYQNSWITMVSRQATLTQPHTLTKQQQKIIKEDKSKLYLQ
jgi:hypothetical protein